MTYRLGENSLKKLSTVKEPLQKVVKLAITYTTQDFSVVQGIRTEAQQREYLKKGTTRTMKSKHLVGKAVDLCPYVDGKPDFSDWDKFYPIAASMQKAAKELNIRIRWGGCWDYINDKVGTPEQWTKSYVQYRKSLGKSAFLDAPHFEIE